MMGALETQGIGSEENRMSRNTLSPFWWQDLIFSPSQLGDSEFRRTF